MPSLVETTEIELSDKSLRTITVACLRKAQRPGSLLAYLQGAASGQLDRIKGAEGTTFTAKQYQKAEPALAVELANTLDGPFQAMFSPPTRRPQLLEPYRQAFTARFPDVSDITSRFRRRDELLAGDKKNTKEAVFANMLYAKNGDEASFRSVVMIDDTYHHGVTAAAAVLHLARAGAPVDGRFCIAAPWWSTAP